MVDQMVNICFDLCSYLWVFYLCEIYGDVVGVIEVMELVILVGFFGQEVISWVCFILGELYEIYGQLDKVKL